MGIFDRLGGQQKNQQITPDMMRQEIDNIKADTAGYLSQHGFSIPNGMTDPRQITQHLLRTGQVGAGMLQQVMRLFGR